MIYRYSYLYVIIYFYGKNMEGKTSKFGLES